MGSGYGFTYRNRLEMWMNREISIKLDQKQEEICFNTQFMRIKKKLVSVDKLLTKS